MKTPFDEEREQRAKKWTELFKTEHVAWDRLIEMRARFNISPTIMHDTIAQLQVAITEHTMACEALAKFAFEHDATKKR